MPEKTKHDWEYAGKDKKYQYAYVEVCERCGTRRRIIGSMVMETKPEHITVYCEDTLTAWGKRP